MPEQVFEEQGNARGFVVLLHDDLRVLDLLDFERLEALGFTHAIFGLFLGSVELNDFFELLLVVQSLPALVFGQQRIRRVFKLRIGHVEFFLEVDDFLHLLSQVVSDGVVLDVVGTLRQILQRLGALTMEAFDFVWVLGERKPL